MAYAARPGDVLGIPDDNELVVVQVSHVHKGTVSFGPLLRVLGSVKTASPQALEALVAEDHLFQAFCPVNEMVASGDMVFLGRWPVPASAQDFPLFRYGFAGLGDRRVRKWFLWDGASSQPLTSLTDNWRRLPIREGVDPLSIVRRVRTGWTPESDGS